MIDYSEGPALEAPILAHDIISNGVDYYVERGVQKATAQALVKNASEYLLTLFKEEE